MEESNIDCSYTACLYYPPSRLDDKPCCRCDMSSPLPSCYTATSGYVQDDSLKTPAWFTGGDRGEIFG